MNGGHRAMRNVLIMITAAVMIMSAADFVIPQSAAAKSRTITIRCVCGGKVVKGPTFEEDGSKALKCSICGQAGCRNTESERLFHEEAADARADDTGNR